MKKGLLIVLCSVICIGGMFWWHDLLSRAEVVRRASVSLAGSVTARTNLPPVVAQAARIRSGSREMDLTVNPYAGGLRDPGKSKRKWEADYIESFLQAKSGDGVRFELTGGVMALGSIKMIQISGGKVTYVSGELSAPESGKFFFLTPPIGGKAGSAVGVAEFPGSKTAYRVEPTGPGGAPELWQRRLDEVICLDMPKVNAAAQAAAQAATNQTEDIPPLRPDMVSDYVPSYNANIVSLQSYPGSSAVLLLDFFGGYTPTWGGVIYARPPVDNPTIKDIWKRVAEDYMPFNINVTTDIKIYQAAPAASRQRCCFTTTPITAAGVAYEGSWNWGNDTPCWSVYYVGKPAAEVGAHEPGHTLGLSHETQDIPNGTNAPTHNEYFTGQGSGATGWAPIMGAAYYQPVTTWAKGEYLYAGNLQDQLNIIATANNNVTYRTDDTGSTLATSRYLEVYTNNSAFAEGVIEQTADTDAFQFTTTGGVVSLTANPVGDWADLAMMATLADATETIIASNNSQTVLSATITTNLPAGTYTFRVTGAGRNDPVTNGFSNYASLGYYSVTGTVTGARQPTRLSVAEHATNNTLVGSVPANNPNGSPLAYGISSGNTGATFSVDNSGVVRVSNNTLLDYYKLASNTMYAMQFELFMNITNVNNPALTELNRRVVIAVLQLYPPVPAALTAAADSSLRIDLSWMGGQAATSYYVKRSTIHGGPYATVASPTDVNYTDGGLTNGVTYYYVVSALNAGGESSNSLEASAMAQAVADYGFEISSIGSGNYSYNPNGSFWTFSGTAGNGSGIVANGSGFSNPNAPEGTQAAFIQEYGSVTQTLAGFTPGTNYTISYSAAQRSGASQNEGESWNVVIDGNVIKANSPGSTSYSTYTATFTATATTHTLAFVGTDLVGGDNTVFIDNVRFSPVLQPAPASVVLASPANNAAFDISAPINLTATVTTNENIINGVQFYMDTITLLGQITNAPYTFALANISAGRHNVFARVLFNNGSVANSSPISLAVINHYSNFGFEAPSLGSGNYAYAPIGGSWTFTSSADGNGSGIAANGSAFGNPNAPEGTQAAMVQSYGSISQTLTGFAPGTNYTITYFVAQRGTVQNGGESWNVVIDNTVISSNSPGATNYTSYSASFTAAAVTHTLSFVGTDLATGDNTVFIDNVVVNPPTSPILIPNLTTNTLPVTAADVVGSQVTFIAAFSSTNPITYQWQKIASGIVNNIVGATNTMLTLTNLQLIDAASYRLQASNSLGIAVSAASQLMVTNVPVAVNNVIIAYAAQTGLGSALTNFAPTWTVAPGSLIAGQTPNSVGSGSFSQNVAVLTDGAFGWLNYWPNVGSSPTEVTCGTSAGQSATYTLGSSASGYIITNIVVYGGWGDAGRDQQAYTIFYSTVAAPTNFVLLASANFNPSNPNAVQSATRATFSSSTTGPLATNVAALMFDFTTPAPENGFCGYSEIDVYGTSINPALTMNTSPVTAADVVGSQITFTAAFTGVGPLAYQWRKISGGVTNNVAGATNTILTLTNFTLANTAAYQLQASNAYGVAVSTPSSLTVSSVPAAVNNVVTSMAAQTGNGSGTFTPTWTVTTNSSLIAGKMPSNTNGSFTLEIPGRNVGSLTAGGNGAITKIAGTSGNTTSVNYVTCGNGGGAGSLIVYTLNGSASGFDLTNIMVYGGWADAGRDQQAYTVYYSTVAAPTTFILLGSVNYNPANPVRAQSATRATLTPATGVLASRVAAVKFDFTTPTSENGYCGYAEINLAGTPSSQPAKWAVGNGNWDTNSLNWKLLSGGNAVSYVENNLASFDDSATGSSPLTVTLTGNHAPSILTNNSTKNYILAGGFGLTDGRLVKDGSSTLVLDNSGVNGFSGILINNGTLQVGSNDANGTLGTSGVTNNGLLIFTRTDAFAVNNIISGSGAVVQNGSGALVVGASNTYAGNTFVNAGTLTLTGLGSISTSAVLVIASGATLDVSGRSDQTLTLNIGQTLKGGGSINGTVNALTGSILNPGDTIGTLLVQSNITLSGLLVLEINRTNEPANDELVSAAGTIAGEGTLTVTNLGPPLQAGDNFKLFNQPVSGFTVVNLPELGSNAWANNLANNGTLTVVSTSSPNLMAQVAGGNLMTLTWPADHTGWRLEMQTNDVTQGLTTNWVEILGATTTNQITFPINATAGTVFYRLLFP